MEAEATTSEAQALTDLVAVARQAVGCNWETACDQDLLAALNALPGLRNQLDSIAARVASVAQRFGAVQRAGSRTAATHVGATTNTEPAQIRADVRAGTWLDGFDKFAEAHNQGILSRRHVDLLRRSDNPVTADALRADQAMLVDFAKNLSFQDFSKALQYWVNAVDSDGRLPDDQVARADFRIRRHNDGTVTVSAKLDPLVGTAVFNAFEAEQQKLRRADLDNDTDRSARQRRVAAAANLFDRGAQRADGKVSTPLINIVMSQQIAEALVRRLEDPTVAIPIDFSDVDGRCEFLDGTPVHPNLALAALGVANLRRIVLSADSRPIDASVNTDRFPGWMKQAILVASRGRCREPGCDAPIHWIQADHIFPRSRGGPTNITNLDPLCAPANKAKSDRVNPASTI